MAHDLTKTQRQNAWKTPVLTGHLWVSHVTITKVKRPIRGDVGGLDGVTLSYPAHTALLRLRCGVTRGPARGSRPGGGV